MKIITSKFKPSWWCKQKHLQTLYPTFFRKKVKLKTKEEILELPDGDFIDLNWTDIRKDSPIIIVLHGLEGSINSPYAKGILKVIQDNNWQAVLMHFRGCGNSLNRLDRSYHSGDTKDLEVCLNTIREKYPNRKIAAIGVSLGGNVLLKYLGEQGNKTLLTAAMAISVPFDLAESAKSLNTGFSKLYQTHLIRLLRNKMQKKFKTKSAPIDINRIKQWKDFYTFDDNVTAPIHGFKSASDYYTKSSSKQYLKSIEKPTWIIHSKDDPFLHQQAIPKESELSDHVTLELTDSGGHVGFIYGSIPFREKYWFEKRINDFFKPLLN